MADGVLFDKPSAKRIELVVHDAESRARGAGGGPPRERPTIPNEKFLARITGSASLATNRWKYAWTEVLMTADLTTTRVGGRTGTTGTNYATNTAEMYHTSTYAWGVNTTNTNYQTAFDPMPIGGGGTSTTHKYDVVVEITQVIDTAGNKKYWFTLMGSHDGNCD